MLDLKYFKSALQMFYERGNALVCKYNLCLFKKTVMNLCSSLGNLIILPFTFVCLPNKSA